MVSDARRLKALDDEHRRLKRLVADQALDNAALKDVLTRYDCSPGDLDFLVYIDQGEMR